MKNFKSKILIVIILSFSVVPLVSCGNKNKTDKLQFAKKEKSSTEEKNLEKPKSSKNIPIVKPWNAEKEQELAEFMRTWGNEMNQNYTSYSPDYNLDLYGLSLPNEILFKNQNNTSWKPAVNEKPVIMDWSDDGLSQVPTFAVNNSYAVVAVYSDKPQMIGQHVYFFCIINKDVVDYSSGHSVYKTEGVNYEPVVLITQQNQGNLNNYLYFKETENEELKAAFSKIVSE